MRKLLYIALFAILSHESSAAAAEVEVKASRGPLARIGAWIASWCTPSREVIEAAKAAQRPATPPADPEETIAAIAAGTPSASLPTDTERQISQSAPVAAARAGIDSRLGSTRTIEDRLRGLSDEGSPGRSLSVASGTEVRAQIAAAVAAPSDVPEEEEEGSSLTIRRIGSGPGETPEGEFRAIVARRQDPARTLLHGLSLRNPVRFYRILHPAWSEDQVLAATGDRGAIQRLHPAWPENQVLAAIKNGHTALSPRVTAALDGEDHDPQVGTPEGLDDDDDDSMPAAAAASPLPVLGLARTIQMLEALDRTQQREQEAMPAAATLAPPLPMLATSEPLAARPRQGGLPLTHEETLIRLQESGAFGPHQGFAPRLEAMPAAAATAADGELEEELHAPLALTATQFAAAAAALPGAVSAEAESDHEGEPDDVEANPLEFLAEDNTSSTEGSAHDQGGLAALVGEPTQAQPSAAASDGQAAEEGVSEEVASIASDESAASHNYSVGSDLSGHSW